jgi:hypothetical protein
MVQSQRVYSTTSRESVSREVEQLVNKYVQLTNLQRQGKTSKRRNKSRSGKAGRRSYNGQRTIAAVGGYANHYSAVYAPMELMNRRLPQCDDPTSPVYNPLVPARLCVVVDDEGREYTTSPGINERYLPGKPM